MALGLVNLLILFHELHKVKKLFYIVNSYNVSDKKKQLILAISLSCLIAGITLLYFADKTVFAFAYFTSGAIVYMAAFVVLKSMRRYFFSFRLVLFDTVTMGVLVISSTYYPVNNFRIFSFYKLIGIYLIIGVLLLNAGILYILVNVVRRDLK